MARLLCLTEMSHVLLTRRPKPSTIQLMASRPTKGCLTGRARALQCDGLDCFQCRLGCYLQLGGQNQNTGKLRDSKTRGQEDWGKQTNNIQRGTAKTQSVWIFDEKRCLHVDIQIFYPSFRCKQNMARQCIWSNYDFEIGALEFCFVLRAPQKAWTCDSDLG